MTDPTPLFGCLGASGQGVPPSVSLIYWFYVEGIGFTIALLCFYHTFVRKGWPFWEVLARVVDRAIIDDFYHKYLPAGIESAYRKLFHGFETPVIDEGYNIKLVDGVLRIGGRLRRIQTGRINHYLIALGLGVIFFVVALFGMIL